MKILKASAGSGKTYRLANKYLDILLSSDDRYIYRHILAVTFTNKATAEMKARILKALRERSASDPKARRLLVDMLHDYGAFSVSTIDKFFQQALKAFSREIGQFADYQVELDRNSLIEETMDRILDSLTEDQTELFAWFKAGISDSLEQGQRFNIEDALYGMGKMLKSEEHRELAEKTGLKDSEAFSKDRLKLVRAECRRIIQDFSEKAAASGIPVKPGEKIKMPGKRALKAAPAELVDLFGEPYRIYCTMWAVDRLVDALGLAGEFYRGFDALMKEKNVMCLDESNTLLRDIIDGSDAPFVYEKLGTRYDHFLLDEFQDTSNIQWDNFLPLLRESESKGGDNLIVGDVKQSIYRWRNSDWTLLGSGVGEAFPGADVEVLDGNWRSARRIVSFNNGFFPFAAKALGLEDIYSDVVQKVCSKEAQEGCVRLSFCDDEQKAVLDSVRGAIAAGARYGDIAILVRNRKEGAELSSLLVSEGIPVISDDSLNLKSSVVVRRLVSLLGCISDPTDTRSAFLVSSLDIKMPERYHSLQDLCEALLRELYGSDPEPFEGEALFIQAFMDELRGWVDVNGSDPAGFLRHWEGNDFYIGSPESASSVRILTVHKAKGLEFPYLIFPYAEKVTMYKGDVHWCSLETEGTGLDPAVGLIYPVELTSSSEQTLFGDDYLGERRMQLVDNMNIFYVALTRASRSLHVIARTPSKKCRESISKGKPEYGNFSEILYDYGGAFEEVSFGTPYDFTKMEREEKESAEPFPGGYVSIPAGSRLMPSDEASDFFGPDGVTGSMASARLGGIALHDILSKVRTPGDLPSAVEAAVSGGILTPDEGAEHGRMLSERIAAHPDWFSGDCRNEVSLFGPDGGEHRPDRVILGRDKTLVIDYKFGEDRKSYLRQVASYVELYRAMGYPDVSGAVWYVREDKVVPVI